jgi:hypothetical protein
MKDMECVKTCDDIAVYHAMSGQERKNQIMSSTQRKEAASKFLIGRPSGWCTMYTVTVVR